MPLGSGGASPVSLAPWVAGETPSRQMPATESEAFRQVLPCLQSELLTVMAVRIMAGVRDGDSDPERLKQLAVKAIANVFEGSDQRGRCPLSTRRCLREADRDVRRKSRCAAVGFALRPF